MSATPTLYTAEWILPVTEAPIRQGSLLVNATGTIERVAATAVFDSLENVERIDLGSAAILPGLVNVHAHPELAGFRGLLEDLPFHQWIPTLMRCKHGAELTLEDYLTAARFTCVESLRAGVTTIGATEDSGAAVIAFTDAGMRGVVYLEVFGPAPAQAEESMRGLREKVARYRERATDRVRLGVSPHAPYTVSDTLFEFAAAFARKEQLPLATHAAEAEAEELLVREALGPFSAGLRSRGIETTPRGRSTIAMLERTGVLDCAPLLIHAVRLSEHDLRTVAAAGASIAHCPVANARLGHGIAPVIEALQAGISVAIGTDSVASNNRLDMLEEAHLAQALQRARLQSASALTSDELLRMVTIDGARILGIADRVGSLEAGKDADFCAIRLDTAHSVPVSDPVSAVFHSARGSDVMLTVSGGRTLYADGRVHSLDEAALAQNLQSIGDRLCRAKAAG